MMRRFNRTVATAALLAIATMIAGGIRVEGQSDLVRLRGLDGSTVDQSSMQGKIVVLAFGGTWVPLASKELPALQKLADRYSPRGVQFFWVSINSDKTGARNYASDSDLTAFAGKNGLKMGIVRDPELEVYRGLGLDALPTVVLFNQEGKIVRKHVGLSPDQPESYNAIMRDIDQLIK